MFRSREQAPASIPPLAYERSTRRASDELALWTESFVPALPDGCASPGQRSARSSTLSSCWPARIWTPIGSDHW